MNETRRPPQAPRNPRTTTSLHLKDDGPFSEEEVRYVAEYVEELYPEGLTPDLFEVVVGPFVFGLGFDEKGNAKLRIFNALPERLRRSFWAALGADLEYAARVSPRAARALGYHINLDELDEDEEAAA